MSDKWWVNAAKVILFFEITKSFLLNIREEFILSVFQMTALVIRNVFAYRKLPTYFGWRSATERTPSAAPERSPLWRISASIELNEEICGRSMGFRWLLSFKYLCFYIFMEVLHTQRFDVFVPKIVIYTLCYLLNCKKKRRCLKLTSPLEIAANVAEFNKHKFRNYAYYN